MWIELRAANQGACPPMSSKAGRVGRASRAGWEQIPKKNTPSPWALFECRPAHMGRLHHMHNLRALCSCVLISDTSGLDTHEIPGRPGHNIVRLAFTVGPSIGPHQLANRPISRHGAVLTVFVSCRERRTPAGRWPVSWVLR